MAQIDISLMPKEVEEKRKKEETRRFASLGSAVVLILGALLTVGVLGFYMMSKREVDSVKKAISLEEAKIEKYKETELAARNLEAKILALSSVFGKTSYYSLLFETLKKMVPEDVTITDLSTVGGGKISVAGLSKSYVSLAKFLLAAKDEGAGGEIFSEAELTSVSLDKDTGEAKFVVNLILKEGALKKGGVGK